MPLFFVTMLQNKSPTETFQCQHLFLAEPLSGLKKLEKRTSVIEVLYHRTSWNPHFKKLPKDFLTFQLFKSQSPQVNRCNRLIEVAWRMFGRDRFKYDPFLNSENVFCRLQFGFILKIITNSYDSTLKLSYLWSLYWWSASKFWPNLVVFKYYWAPVWGTQRYFMLILQGFNRRRFWFIYFNKLRYSLKVMGPAPNSRRDGTYSTARW